MSIALWRIYLVFLVFLSLCIPVETVIDWHWEDWFIGENIELRAKEGKEKGIQRILITCFLIFNPHKSPVRQVLSLFKDEETDLVVKY